MGVGDPLSTSRRRRICSPWSEMRSGECADMSLWTFILLPLVFIVAIQVAIAAAPPKDSGHEDLSYYLQGDGARVPIRTAADWERRRAQIIVGMEQVMGPLPRPAVPVPLDVQVLEEHEEQGYLRRKVAYHTD